MMPFNFSTSSGNGPGAGIYGAGGGGAEFDAGMESMSRQDHGFWGNAVRTIAGGLGPNLVDTTLSSVGITDPGEVNRAFTTTFNLPGYQSWLDQNKGAVDLTSGLAGLVVGELAVTKIGKVIQASSALQRLPGLSKVAKLNDSFMRATQAVKDTDLALLKMGYNDKELLTATAEIGGVAINRAQMASRAKWLGIADTSLHAAAVEGVFALGQNDNTFFFPPGDDVMSITNAALGIAIPAGAKWLQVGHQFKKFINSDIARKAANQFYDPAALDEAIELTSGPFAQTRTKTPADVAAALKDVEIGTTAYFADAATAQLIQRDSRRALRDELQAAPTAESARQSQQAERLADGNENAAFNYLERGMRMGLGFPGTQLGENAAAANTVRYATRQDVAAFYGAERMGVIPEGTTGFQIAEDFKYRAQAKVDEVDREIITTQNSKKMNPQAKAKRLNALAAARKVVAAQLDLVPHEWYNGQWVDPADIAKIGGPPKIGKIQFSQPDEKFAIYEVLDHVTGKPTNIGIDTTGLHYLPQGKQFNDLSHSETLGWFRAADNLIEHTIATGKPFTVPKNAPWQVLDVGLEIEKRAGRPGLVDWGTRSREGAAVDSFKMKAMTIKSFARKNPDLPDFLLAERFNVPAMTSAEIATANGADSNVVRVMRNMIDPRQINSQTEREILDALNSARFTENLFDDAKSGLKSILGNTFRAGKDGLGNELAPIMAFKRSMNAGFFTRDSLEMRMAMGNTQRMTVMTRNAATPLVRSMARVMAESPDTMIAANSAGLHDAQRQGTLPGFGGSVATTTAQFGTFLDRDNPVMLAARRLGTTARKLGEAAYDTVFAPVAPVFAALRTNEMRESKYQVERFITARAGWELDADKTVKNVMSAKGQPAVRFQLAQSEANKVAWYNRYGTQMPADAFLVDAKGNFVELDDAAHNAVEIIHTLFDSARRENNTILRARGLPEIESIPYYVPPKEQTNKFLSFVMDGKNKVRYTISADSERQLDELKSSILKDPKHPANQAGWSIRDRSTIEDFESGIWQRKHFDFAEPSIPVVAAGERRSGSGLSALHEFDAVERVLGQLRTQHVNLGKDVLETIMQPALSSAEQRANALRKEVANVSEGGAQRKISTESRSIHDDYQNALLGRNPLYSRGSPISSTYQVMAGVGDKASAWLGRALFKPGQWVKSSYGSDAKSEFEFLKRSMADQIPFKDVDAFVANKFGTKRLMDSTELTGRISNVTATLTLRIFESAQAIMNMAGNLAMMPAVIRAMAPRAGESNLDLAARLGMDAHVFPRQQGQAVTAINMPGIMAGAFRDAMSIKSHQEWDYMSKRGFVTQEVAEFHRHLSQQSGKQDWTRYIAGTPSGTTFMEKHGVVGAASWLSDGSENFTRGWAHLAGLRVADRIGLKGQELRHGFAHDFANKVIADYNPTNRPEIFQGPVGNTLGLFQSYIWGYYGNLFRAIETKDTSRLMAQMLGQSMFFGAQTIPGFSEYNSLMAGMSESGASPLDRLHQALPTGVADVVMSGIPSSLPQLFGGEDGSGIALTARGDTTVRIPGVAGVPAFAVAKKIVGGIGEMADIFFGENPSFTPMQMTEALSHMIPNRPISGMIANFGAAGQTDPTGQLVGESLDMTKGIATMMGLKTLQDQKMTEAFYANKNEQALQAIKRQELVRNSRTLMRAGDYESLPKIYDNYLATGGDPRRFNGWIAELHESATVSRSERQLADTIDDPMKMEQTMRMLDAMGGSDSVEGPDEP
jgi:hypothetical protein